MSLDKSKFEVEKAGAVATCKFTDRDAFYEGELTKAELKRAFDHVSNYIKKCAEVGEEQAVEIMKADSKINRVNMDLPYGVSKRGQLLITAQRSVTYPGMQGRPSVTRPDLKITVKDPLSKAPKSLMKDLQGKMAAALAD